MQRSTAVNTHGIGPLITPLGSGLSNSDRFQCKKGEMIKMFVVEGLWKCYQN